MISCFADNPCFENLVFLNGESDKIRGQTMLGADFTEDGKTIYSITFPANGEYEFEVLKNLKEYLKSEVGIVYYDIYPGHSNSSDFEAEWAANGKS